jgi:hypothetical protein
MGFINSIPRCYDKGIGGIQEVYTAPWCDVSIYGPDASGYMAVAAADGVTALNSLFVKITPAKFTSDWSDPATGSAENGTVFYAHTLNLVINRTNIITRNALKAMGKKELIFVVVDAKGDNWFLGDANSGLDMLTGGQASGVAAGDRNGATFNFVGNIREPAGIFTDASLASLK